MTDPEKLALLDIAYHAKVTARTAEAVAKTLTALELGPSGDKQYDAALRDKLATQREQFQSAHQACRATLAANVPRIRSSDGPLFDQVVDAMRDIMADGTTVSVSRGPR